ncbi:hypothetical protein ACJ41O_014444 [Fusarium nematophilum]
MPNDDNTVVFKHAPISWEWGIVFVEAVIFFLGIETWKWMKRFYFRRQARKATGGVADLETHVFGHYYEMSSGSQDEEVGQEKRAS